MPDYGNITFHVARASGIEIKQLGSGQADHIGFFGANGTSSAIEVSSFNGTTFVVDLNGTVPAYLGAESGKLMNNKYASASTVEISGLAAKDLDLINVFHVPNLTTYPDFENRPSGTLLIRYCASGTSAVRTYNAKLYGYEAGAALTVVPPDCSLYGYEISASGQTYNAAHSGAWSTMNGQADAMFFADHSKVNGWEPHGEHIFVAGLSFKANSVGVLDEWNFAFQMQFA
jgi:hypothetical protein